MDACAVLLCDVRRNGPEGYGRAIRARLLGDLGLDRRCRERVDDLRARERGEAVRTSGAQRRAPSPRRHA